ICRCAHIWSSGFTSTKTPELRFHALPTDGTQDIHRSSWKVGVLRSSRWVLAGGIMRMVGKDYLPATTSPVGQGGDRGRGSGTSVDHEGGRSQAHPPWHPRL